MFWQIFALGILAMLVPKLLPLILLGMFIYIVIKLGEFEGPDGGPQIPFFPVIPRYAYPLIEVILMRAIDGHVDQADMVVDLYEMPGEVYIEQRGAGNGEDVHDSKIQSDLRASIAKLRAWYAKQEHVDLGRTVKEIKEHIFSYSDMGIKEKAYSTIKHIHKHNDRLHSVDMSEGEILQMVWCRINSELNSSRRTELITNLIELLADAAITLDSAYCLVGRVTRIVQSLQSLDMENIIDIGADKEVQYKICQYSERYFKEHPEKQVAYDGGDNGVAEELVKYIGEHMYGEYDRKIIDDNLKVIM
jgi:hypothetical protein